MPGPRVASDDRVTLRTYEREDVPFVQRSFANPELRYSTGTPVKNEAELEDQFEGGDGDAFVVTLDGDDAPPGAPDDEDVRRIGFVSVADVDWRRPDLGYWIVPDAQGEGYGKTAVSLAIEYVFRTYDVPGVGAVVYDFNDASRGLLESLGFTEEGRIRKDRFVDGRYVDTLQFGLLCEEWDGEA